MANELVPALPEGQLLIYQDGELNVQVRMDGQTVWLTQAAMAELFQTTPQNITIHLRSIYDEGELDEGATCKEYLQVRREGTRQVERLLGHYNLDAILAVGYRVRSARGTAFRQWAAARLSELLVKGFTLDGLLPLDIARFFAGDSSQAVGLRTGNSSKPSSAKGEYDAQNN